MSHHGYYLRRFYLNPHTLAALLKPPEGCEVRTVAWQDDRQSFCVFLDMPPESRWWVDKGAVVPEMPVSVTVITDGKGGQRIIIKSPVFEEESASAADEGRPAKGRRQARAVLAAT